MHLRFQLAPLHTRLKRVTLLSLSFSLFLCFSRLTLESLVLLHFGFFSEQQRSNVQLLISGVFGTTHIYTRAHIFSSSFFRVFLYLYLFLVDSSIVNAAFTRFLILVNADAVTPVEIAAIILFSYIFILPPQLRSSQAPRQLVSFYDSATLHSDTCLFDDIFSYVCLAVHASSHRETGNDKFIFVTCRIIQTSRTIRRWKSSNEIYAPFITKN